MSLTFLSKKITLIGEYYDRVRLGYLSWLGLGKGNIPNIIRDIIVIRLITI
jgi:hypothetical protein